MYEDRFGFLPRSDRIEWENGYVVAVDNHEEVKEAVEEATNPDNYLYPPIVHRVRRQLGEEEPEEEIVEGSAREAHQFSMPASHRIVIPDGEGEVDAFRRGVAGFVIHLLGAVFGYRCEFEGWWIDGRVSMKADTDAVVGYQTLDPILARTVDRWEGVPRKDQVRVVNACYLHNRNPHYYWPWERFLSEYRVFDALYRVACNRYGVHANGHKERWKVVANEFGMYRDDDLFEEIANRRNELVHETLWDAQQPTYDGADRAFRLWLHMRGFNLRTVLALLGVQSDYVRSNWSSIDKWHLAP